MTIKERITKIEKELAEVKAEVNKDYKIGDLINYNNYDWKVTNVIGDDTILTMKDKLPKEKVKLYFEHYEEYENCDDCDVKFSNDNNFDWSESNLRKGMIKFCEAEFNINELILMKTNYDQDKYSEDYMRALTVREVEALPMDIREVDSSYGYWTISPRHFDGAGAGVWIVTSNGNFGGDGVNSAYGVRPVISVKSSILKGE